MPEAAPTRFEARKVVRVTTLTEHGRVEIEFSGPGEAKQVVSLPAAVAVELGCLICELSDLAPYLVGGARRTRSPVAKPSTELD